MGTPVNLYQFNLDIDERKIVDDNLNIINPTKTERNQAIKKFLLNIKYNPTLTTKEQIALEDLKIKQAKAERIKDKESLLLRKLEAETELVERQLNYSNTFNSEPSHQAKQSMRKGMKRKYSSFGQPNYTENIQAKKNFYINKLNNSEYCGVCKVCQKFTTAICITSHEAEDAIEYHLELEHELELYAR